MKCPKCGSSRVVEIDTDYDTQSYCEDCDWNVFVDFED